MQSTMCLCSHFLAVLLISVVFKSVTAMRPSPVTVNKCCGTNQMLNENEHQCIIIGDNGSGYGDDDNGTINSTNWWPLIVLAKKQIFFEPHGNAPRFMKYLEQKPTCANSEFFSGPHKMVLYTNGTLYLPERHKYIELDNYCIDKDSAIVCDPNATIVHTKKPLKKCCAQNAAYKTNQNTCVRALPLIPNNDIQTPLSNSGDYDVQYGFPMCKNSNYFTFESNGFSFDGDSNRLVLKSGHTLAWNEFCLENVVADDNQTELQPDVRVFICADHLSTAANATVALLVVPFVMNLLYKCPLFKPMIFYTFMNFPVGHSVYLISNWLVDFGCIFIGHISDAVCFTHKSSHTPLAVSNISRGVPIDWRS